MSATTNLPDYLRKEILLNPEQRVFPDFSVTRLLHTVFKPTQGCRVCILTDFDEPERWMKDFSFLESDDFEVQKNAYHYFYESLRDGVMDELGMTGGEMFAYRCTHGSNLDLSDEVWDSEGHRTLSQQRHLSSLRYHPVYFHIFSNLHPLTERCKVFGFRGATMHGMNEVILRSGLAVDYEEVSDDAEKIRKALDRA